jgi:hypothetical protein
VITAQSYYYQESAQHDQMQSSIAMGTNFSCGFAKGFVYLKIDFSKPTCPLKSNEVQKLVDHKLLMSKKLCIAKDN